MLDFIAGPNIVFTLYNSKCWCLSSALHETTPKTRHSTTLTNSILSCPIVSAKESVNLGCFSEQGHPWDTNSMEITKQHVYLLEESTLNEPACCREKSPYPITNPLKPLKPHIWDCNRSADLYLKEEEIVSTC